MLIINKINQYNGCELTVVDAFASSPSKIIYSLSLNICESMFELEQLTNIVRVCVRERVICMPPAKSAQDHVRWVRCLMSDMCVCVCESIGTSTMSERCACAMNNGFHVHAKALQYLFICLAHTRSIRHSKYARALSFYLSLSNVPIEVALHCSLRTSHSKSYT